ncbi:hypothetical protein [Caldalkalibacillus mannanilyticus]|uniref:hypothetical protein n=1 Tax=Caldalkalibacillus mannanilyticus TaxID=1418 RepID=UPI000A73AF99|nr:hypothetical protein [Caldalkalibacillus mannanilyticus]
MKKEQEQEWKLLGDEQETEKITGRISHHFLQKKKFNDRYWYMELEGTIVTDTDQQRMKLIWKKPYTPDLKVPKIEKNSQVQLYGRRNRNTFHANRILPKRGWDITAENNEKWF